MLLGKYPVDTLTNIKAASDYFSMYEKKFSDLEKVAFASGLAKRMREEGFELPEKVAHYANAKARNNFELGIRLRNMATGGNHADELAEITKIASRSAPLERVALLDDFDSEYHLKNSYNKLVPTPFDSIFMSEKVASDLSGESVWTSPTSDRLSKNHFLTWSQSPSNRQLLIDRFGYDLGTSLCEARAWDIFSSLPDPHKQVIARMVNDNVINGTNSPGLSRYSVAGAESHEQQYETASQKLERLINRA